MNILKSSINFPLISKVVIMLMLLLSIFGVGSKQAYATDLYCSINFNYASLDDLTLKENKTIVSKGNNILCDRLSMEVLYIDDFENDTEYYDLFVDYHNSSQSIITPGTYRFVSVFPFEGTVILDVNVYNEPSKPVDNSNVKPIEPTPPTDVVEEVPLTAEERKAKEEADKVAKEIEESLGIVDESDDDGTVGTLGIDEIKKAIADGKANIVIKNGKFFVDIKGKQQQLSPNVAQNLGLIADGMEIVMVVDDEGVETGEYYLQDNKGEKIEDLDMDKVAESIKEEEQIKKEENTFKYIVIGSIFLIISIIVMMFILSKKDLLNKFRHFGKKNKEE